MLKVKGLVLSVRYQILLAAGLMIASELQAGVMGYIDGVSDSNDQAVIHGWACDSGVNASINVHVYTNGPAGSGRFLKAVAASSANEPAVNGACGTSSARHRFDIPLSNVEKLDRAGQTIFIHGISMSNGPNLTLTNSGNFLVPPRQVALDVRGYVDGVALVNGTPTISGWACQPRNNSSIPISVYTGGPKGTGLFLKNAVANQANEPAVNQACETTTALHRFFIPLTASEMQDRGRQSIYIHGDPSSSNNYLSQSGQFLVPVIETKTVKLSQVALSGQDLTIAADQIVEIDSSVDIGVLTIQGTLRCPDSGQFQLQTSGILVGGVFLCGSSQKPFSGKLSIVVKPGRNLSKMGERAILVVSGGRVELAGPTGKSKWLHLSAHAEVGSNLIKLEEAVNDWQAGDEIVIASTSFDPQQAERFRINRVDGNTVYLQSNLKFRHWGTQQAIQVGARAWTLDERAEVANLTRNIRILASGTEASHNQMGAHMMVMAGGAAFINAVEFDHVGQMGVLGMYPFHWHRAGDVNGQYIMNSSIHDSYQRCVTVHMTQNALVQNNVCFNHFGHGFFLEEGGEVRNQILGNLGILSKVIPQGRELLISDVVGDPNRFAAPATFWISNPNNRVSGNVAAGSQGTGFWMSFNESLFCTATHCLVDKSDKANFFPLKQKTWEFNNNTAHSNAVGITWDGAADGALRNNPRHKNDRELISAHYAPPDEPVFSNLVAYKNTNAGFYFRGTTAEFNKSLAADNGWSHFHAYNQIVSDSLVVGISQNHSASEFDYMIDRIGRFPFVGIIVYDGPFELRHVDFSGFSGSQLIHRGRDVTPIPISNIGGAARYTNTTMDLKFAGEPYRRYVQVPDNWLDSPWSTSTLDLDGSLTGSAGTLIIPNHPFVDHPSCQFNSNWNARFCRYQTGLFSFRGPGVNYLPFKVTRQDGVVTVSDPASLRNQLHNKFNMILNEGYEYTVDFDPQFQNLRSLGVTFFARTIGELSAVIHLRNFGSNCRLSGYTRYSSLAKLRRASASGFYSAGDQFSLRLATIGRNPNNRGANASHGWSGDQPVICDENR